MVDFFFRTYLQPATWRSSLSTLTESFEHCHVQGFKLSWNFPSIRQIQSHEYKNRNILTSLTHGWESEGSGTQPNFLTTQRHERKIIIFREVLEMHNRNMVKSHFILRIWAYEVHISRNNFPMLNVFIPFYLLQFRFRRSKKGLM